MVLLRVPSNKSGVSLAAAESADEAVHRPVDEHVRRKKLMCWKAR